MNPDLLTEELEGIRSHPNWQAADEERRREMAREIAKISAAEDDPEYHDALTSALWGEVNPDGMGTRAAKWVGNAVKEVALSIPAAGVAAGMAASDAVGATDTGSGTRLTRGVANLWDAAGQRLKQLAPGDKQEELAAALDDLQADFRAGAVPPGVRDWLAGDEPPDEESRAFADLMTRGLARLAVQADHSDWTPEQEAAYLASDRSLARPDSEAREFLADYLVTRDPASWEGFVSRVTETDAQHATRLARAKAEQGTRQWLADQPEWVQSMGERGMDMQASPIDMASAALPLLRGVKLLKAVKAGKRSATGGLAVDSLKEGAQEAVTATLEDHRNTAAQIAEAGAMGFVGNVGVQGPFAVAGRLMRGPGTPDAATTPPVPPETGDSLLGQIGMRQAAAAGSAPVSPPEPVPAAPSPAPPAPAPSQTVDSPGTRARPPLGSAADVFVPDDPQAAAVPAPTAPATAVPVPAAPNPETAPPAVVMTPGPQAAAALPASVITPAAAPASPAPVLDESPVSPARVRAATRTLTTQGVDAETAALLGARLAETLPPETDMETLRQRVLEEFRAAGGVLPGETPLLYVEQPEAYEAQGYSPEQAAEHARNAQAANAAAVEAAHQSNRTLAEQLSRPRVRMSTPPQAAGPVWREIAVDEDSFQLGGEPTVKSVPELSAFYSKKGQRLAVSEAEPMDPRADRAWNIQVENGGTAVLMQSPDGQVWLNTAGLESDQTKSGGGAPVYQLAQSYAANNGLKFRADPRGLSPKAKVRRISQLISSILRHGTDRHLDLLTPDDFGQVELPSFKPGQTDANLEALLRREYEYVKEAGLKHAGLDLDALTLDPESNTLRDERTGQTLTEDAFESLVERFEPARSGVGPATLLRAVVTGSARRAQARGSGRQWHERFSRLHSRRKAFAQSRSQLRGRKPRSKPDDSQGRFPEFEALAQPGQGGPPGSAAAQAVFRPVDINRRLLYRSASDRGPGSRVGVRSDQAQDALRGLRQHAPELARNTRLLPNRDALNEADYHPEDWAAFESSEGFYDPRSGEVVVFTDNVTRRQDETPMRAVARVILHERLAHAGLAALRAGDEAAAKRWDALVEQALADPVTGPQIRAIAGERAYAHLADDPAALVEEWAAREVEKMTPAQVAALKPGSLLGRFLRWVREQLAKQFTFLARNTLTHSELKELLGMARQALAKADGGPVLAAVADRERMRLTSPDELPPASAFVSRPITSAPAVVAIPKVNLPRHADGMIAGLRAWLKSARDSLTQRLRAFTGAATGLNWGKLSTFKTAENPLHHFQALSALPELYRDSVVAGVAADLKRDSGVMYERRYAWALFPDGQRRHVLITSRLYPDATKPPGIYSLEALEIEVREAPLTYMASAARGEAKAFDQGAQSLPTGAQLAEFLAGIKSEHQGPPSRVSHSAPQQPPSPDQEQRAWGQRARADDRLDQDLRDHLGPAETYDVAHNEDTMAAAAALIDQHGLDGARQMLFNEANGMPAHVRVTLGQQLLLRLDKAARAATDPAQRQALYDAAYEVSSYTDRKGTEAGQTVQAFAMWARMTPEGVLMQYDRRLREANGGQMPKLPDELLDKLGKLRDQINELPEDSTLRNDAMRELLTELARYEGLPIGSVFSALWYANLLSGLSTQGVNVWGNGLHLAARTLATGLAAHPADTLQLLRGMLRGLGRGFLDAKAALRGKQVTKGARKYDVPAVHDFAQQSALEIALSQPPSDWKGWVAWIGSVGGLSKFVFRALQAMDAVFWNTAAEGRAHLAASRAARQGFQLGTPEFQRAMADMLGGGKAAFEAALDQAANELRAAGRPVDFTEQHRRAWEIVERQRPETITEEARRWGDMNTFQEEPRGIGKYIFNAITALQSFTPLGLPVLRPLVPFAKIPANVFASALDFTPVGILRGISGSHISERNLLNWGKLKPDVEAMTALERRERIAAGVLGTLVGGLAYALAQQFADEDDEAAPFMIYGAGRGNRDKNATMPRGWKPYTIKIGGTYISYSETPMALMLAPIGALMDAERYNTGLSKKSWALKTEYLLRAMGGTVMAQGSLSSAADVLDVLTGRTKFEKLPSRVSSGFIPLSGLMRDITPLYDPVRIGDESVLASMFRDVPVIRHVWGKPAINILGEEVTSEGLERVPVVKRFFINQREHPQASFLARHKLTIPGFEQHIEAGAYLSAGEKTTLQASRSRRADTLARLHANMLTDDERYTFVKRAGELTREAVERLRQQHGPRAAVDAAIVQDQLDAAVRAARKTAMREVAGAAR